MDVTDTGSRSVDERVEEELWLGRMRSHPPGLDPPTNALHHNDLVATAAPQAAPVPVEKDGSIIGGEKERILAHVFMEQHTIDSGGDIIDSPPVPGEGNPPVTTGDPYDMWTPIGTPEGWRPGPGVNLGATTARPIDETETL